MMIIWELFGDLKSGISTQFWKTVRSTYEICDFLTDLPEAILVSEFGDTFSRSDNAEGRIFS